VDVDENTLEPLKESEQFVRIYRMNEKDLEAILEQTAAHPEQPTFTPEQIGYAYEHLGHVVRGRNNSELAEQLRRQAIPHYIAGGYYRHAISLCIREKDQDLIQICWQNILSLYERTFQQTKRSHHLGIPRITDKERAQWKKAKRDLSIYIGCRPHKQPPEIIDAEALILVAHALKNTGHVDEGEQLAQQTIDAFAPTRRARRMCASCR
jgi:hypothetical protein